MKTFKKVKLVNTHEQNKKIICKNMRAKNSIKISKSICCGQIALRNRNNVLKIFKMG